MATCLNMKKAADKIVKWLIDYSERSGLYGFVVGVSGGVDSAVVSKLCALTQKEVLVVTLPIHQEKKQYKRSLDHCWKLAYENDNVEHINIDLSTTYDTLVKVVEKGRFTTPLSLANTKSRLRMVALYQIAGSRKLLVAGTGNKVEDYGIGFFTKYGDGGVDISPIGDMTKTEVWGMARYLRIHEDIIKAPPTDGLWDDNRSDEDQIGCTYKDLEIVMSGKGKPKNKYAYELYESHRNKNLHKMRKIPVCVIH